MGIDLELFTTTFSYSDNRFSPIKGKIIFFEK